MKSDKITYLEGICEDEIFLSFFEIYSKYGSVFELAILVHWLSVIPVSKPSYIISFPVYLFIYSSSGSLLLHVGFTSCIVRGYALVVGAQVSHCGGFFCFRVLA